MAVENQFCDFKWNFRGINISKYNFRAAEQFCVDNTLGYIFSSPEPKAHLWAYSIGRRPSSVVRLSTFSNIFSSDGTGPIEAKFYVEALWVGGTKIPSNGHGHMTKMAAMPIYGKHLKNLLL